MFALCQKEGIIIKPVYSEGRDLITSLLNVSAKLNVFSLRHLYFKKDICVSNSYTQKKASSMFRCQNSNRHGEEKFGPALCLPTTSTVCCTSE